MKTVIFILYCLIWTCTVFAAVCGVLLYIYGILLLIRCEKVDIFWSLIAVQGAPAFLIGLLILLLSTLGCYGVLHENIILLAIYASFLLVFVFVNTYIAKNVMEFIRRPDDLQTLLSFLLLDGFTNKTAQTPETMEDLQRKGKCCGIYGPGEVRVLVEGNFTTFRDEFCNNNYADGCAAVISGEVIEDFLYLGYIYAVSAIVMFVLAIIVFATLKTMRKYVNSKI
ncbi:unnamed protein product [Tenebrio molitor]|nr:unnamed protein product [Tenebrio molitor]